MLSWGLASTDAWSTVCVVKAKAFRRFDSAMNLAVCAGSDTLGRLLPPISAWKWAENPDPR